MSDGLISGPLFMLMLGVGVMCWFMLRPKGQRSLAQRSTDWGMGALGVIVALGIWGDLQDRHSPVQAVVGDGARIEVPRSSDGHYHLIIGVNGTPVEFLVDTGASSVVLSDRDARRAGIDVDNLAFTGFANTANGTVRTADVWVDELALGGVTVRNFPVSVNGGEMDFSLLGMEYLETFDRIEISGGRLVLER